MPLHSYVVNFQSYKFLPTELYRRLIRNLTSTWDLSSMFLLNSKVAIDDCRLRTHLTFQEIESNILEIGFLLASCFDVTKCMN
jgi:hypothetical protein